MKTIYYYHRLYPERNILKLEVIDELFLKGKGIKAIQYLVTNYDIERYEKSENVWLSIYAPYKDNDIYSHDFSNSRYGGDVVLSYNFTKLKELWKDCFKYKKEELEKRIEEFNKIVLEREE